MMLIEAIYSPTIMDGPAVRFQTGWQRGIYRDKISGQQRTDWSAEINASRNGVMLNGAWPSYTKQDEIDSLKRVLDEAFRAYQSIRFGRDGGHDEAKAIVERFNSAKQSELTPVIEEW